MWRLGRAQLRSVAPRGGGRMRSAAPRCRPRAAAARRRPHCKPPPTAGPVRCWSQDPKQNTIPASIANDTFTAVTTPHYAFSCAISAAGLARCWNVSGVVGLPADLANTQVVAVSAGSYHGCAITAAGPVRCWGNDYETNSTAVPAELANGSVAAGSISCGNENSCAVTKSGAALCWGDNKYNQGNVPSDLGSVSLLCAANAHTCAVTVSNTVRCWGFPDGRLDAPQALVGKAISSIVCGDSHTCAIAGGAAYCWGSSNIPGDSITPPADLGAVVAVSAGSSYSCAILASGAVRCWGKGQPDATHAPRPTDFDGVVHTSISSLFDTCYILSPSGGEMFAAGASAWEPQLCEGAVEALLAAVRSLACLRAERRTSNTPPQGRDSSRCRFHLLLHAPPFPPIPPYRRMRAWPRGREV